MPNEVKKRTQRAIAEKVFPGCVIGSVRQNGTRTILPLGSLAYNDEPVREDTIYDLASVTKSIPVASLSLSFIAESKLKLDDKVKKFIPELQNHFDATIEDLLRYRVKGSQMSSLKYKTFQEIRTHIFEHGFDGAPGESVYTNLPAFLLGIILERIGGEILPALANRYFFEPLNMRDTTFFPHDIDRIAPTEILAPERLPNFAYAKNVDVREIRGIVHDESARMFAKKRRAVGHAGLFSTMPDLLNFLEALLDENVGHRMSYIVKGAQMGLGWELGRDWMGISRPRLDNARFGKTGFTGTSVLCDIEKGIGLVILSNRTYPHRPPDNSAINSFRADISDILLA